MAVIEDVPGIEVTVLVDRKKAIEYEADDELKRSLTKHACPTATKYIESINDASFSIRLDARRDYAWGYKKHALVFETDVDGDFISSKVLSSPKTKTIDGKKAYCQKSLSWKCHTFKFSTVEIVDNVDEEHLAKDLQAVRNLGLITVTVERRIKICRQRAFKNPLGSNKKLKLSAKSMKGKAISHGTIFSTGKQIHARSCWNTKRVPNDTGPIAVFNFLYRSKEALRQNLVIPRDLPADANKPRSIVKCSPKDDENDFDKASLPPLPEQEFGNLSRTEIERLARERFEQIQTHERVKLEDEIRSSKRRSDGSKALTGAASNPRPTK